MYFCLVKNSSLIPKSKTSALCGRPSTKSVKSVLCKENLLRLIGKLEPAEGPTGPPGEPLKGKSLVAGTSIKAAAASPTTVLIESLLVLSSDFVLSSATFLGICRPSVQTFER